MCLHARTPNAAESKELSRWLKRPRNAVQMRRGQLMGQRMQEYLRWRRRNKADAKLVKVQNSMPTL